MTQEQITQFFERIDKLTISHQPKFGQMNVQQMVCHCADQIRLALGTIRAEEYGALSPEEVMAIAKARKTVPAAKGLGMVEGGGTPLTTLENDIKILKEHILEFSQLQADFNFQPHPYFGDYDKKQWTGLTIYHLNHHLKQFRV